MDRTGAWLRAAMRRMARGERWWAAEIGVRAVGVALLALCAAAAWKLYRSVSLPAPHPARLGDYPVAALVVLSWWFGGAFTTVGPGLFKHIPVPGRHWVP